jgi:uroporphyrinogen-III synthase
MKLSGKTILITRAVHQATEFVQAIERYGGNPVVFPTIEITPPASWEACDRAIDGLYMYDGLIFTSSNAVEFFFKRLSEREIPFQDLKSKTVFVVGEATKQAVEQHGLSVTAMPEKFTAFDLVKALHQEDLKDKCFLFPRGNLGNNNLRDNLKILGAQVESVIVYQTQRPAEQNINQIKSMILQEKIDIVTFTSPSTFKNFAVLFSSDELKHLQQHVKIAAIGPVTAEAVEEFNLEVDILSKESTTDSLIQSILNYVDAEKETLTKTSKTFK